MLPVRNASRRDAGGEYCVFFMAQRTANNRRLNLRGPKGKSWFGILAESDLVMLPLKKNRHKSVLRGDFLSSFAEPLLLVPYAPFS